jgi:hypothetical protein
MARKDISDSQVLQVYLDERSGLARIALLMERTGQPEKVCYRAMERAGDRGYIEYGVSLRSGWLTNEGLALLGLPASTRWPQVIGVDLASDPDKTATGTWDPITKEWMEQVTGQSFQDWQVRLFNMMAAEMKVPPSVIRGAGILGLRATSIIVDDAICPSTPTV